MDSNFGNRIQNHLEEQLFGCQPLKVIGLNLQRHHLQSASKRKHNSIEQGPPICSKAITRVIENLQHLTFAVILLTSCYTTIIAVILQRFIFIAAFEIRLQQI